MSKKKKSSPKSRNTVKIAILILALVLLAVQLCVIIYLQTDEEIELSSPTDAQTDATLPLATEQAPFQPVLEFSPMDLGQGLRITDIGGYTGAYVEDGSDEVVSDVLMVVLENTSDKALQYANITLYFGETAADFTVTSIPAGQRVVLLEKNRMPFTGHYPDSFLVQDLLFLPELEMYGDVFEITGDRASLTVKNISDETITGDIYIYYKNTAQDIYYGGITYRARIEGGLEPGQSKSAIAGHYNPSGSAILMVTYIP